MMTFYSPCYDIMFFQHLERRDRLIDRYPFQKDKILDAFKIIWKLITDFNKDSAFLNDKRIMNLIKKIEDDFDYSEYSKKISERFDANIDKIYKQLIKELNEK